MHFLIKNCKWGIYSIFLFFISSYIGLSSMSQLVFDAHSFGPEWKILWMNSKDRDPLISFHPLSSFYFSVRSSHKYFFLSFSFYFFLFLFRFLFFFFSYFFPFTIAFSNNASIEHSFLTIFFFSIFLVNLSSSRNLIIVGI